MEGLLNEKKYESVERRGVGLFRIFQIQIVGRRGWGMR